MTRPTRNDAVETFLAQSDWRTAARISLAGDASARRYLRLDGGPTPALLMDAPPDSGEDVRPFLHIAALLQSAGLSVPRIYAADENMGFLLIEDMGDGLFARIAAADPPREVQIYAEAARALALLHRVQSQDLPAYGPLMADLSGLVLDWYAPEARDARPTLVAAMDTALAHPALAPAVFTHRDFHAENLIWLPDRRGAARVGMIDFQDAMAGPPDYDLASLVHDPRRVVTDAARQAATQTYIRETGRDAETVAAGLAVASAQRCLRILGVFSRLCLRDGKTHYPDFIPRTWSALTRDLGHPALAELRAVVAETIPAPTPQRLDAIRARAGQFGGQPHADTGTPA